MEKKAISLIKVEAMEPHFLIKKPFFRSYLNKSKLQLRQGLWTPSKASNKHPAKSRWGHRLCHCHAEQNPSPSACTGPNATLKEVGSPGLAVRPNRIQTAPEKPLLVDVVPYLCYKLLRKKSRGDTNFTQLETRSRRDYFAATRQMPEQNGDAAAGRIWGKRRADLHKIWHFSSNLEQSMREKCLNAGAPKGRGGWLTRSTDWLGITCERM